MSHMIRIATAVVLVGIGSSVALAQDPDVAEPHVVYDQERGELSVGTQMPGKSAVLNAIRSGSPSRVMAMLEYGERLECYECVPALQRRMLEDDNARVREFAAWWLRRRTFAIGQVMRDMRTILANDEDEVRRSRAAEAIGEFLDPRGLAPLTQAAMADQEPIVRAAAVRALGRLNHPEGNTVLARALGDADVAVRRAAIGQVLKVNFFREFDALIGRLADDDAVVRRRAAKLLGELRVAEAAPALVGLLEGDADRDVRQAAAWALGRIGGAEARGALTEARESEIDSLVRDAIRIALAM